MGCYGQKNKYVFSESLSAAEIVYRKEYEQLKELYPNLDDMIAERYRQLRGTVLSREYIDKNAEYILGKFENSGAPERDAQRWEYEKDNDIGKLYSYIEARLKAMDGFYGV